MREQVGYEEVFIPFFFGQQEDSYKEMIKRKKKIKGKK